MGSNDTPLNAKNVNRIFGVCLIWSYEKGAEFVTAECVKTVQFHQARLNRRIKDIRDMLGQLNERFRGPKGWGFLAASVTWDGQSWAGEGGREDLIEKLVLLGRAIGAVEYLVPLQGCDDWPDFRLNL